MLSSNNNKKKNPKAIYCKLYNATKTPQEFHFSTHPQNLLGRDKSISLSDIYLLQEARHLGTLLGIKSSNTSIPHSSKKLSLSNSVQSRAFFRDCLQHHGFTG